MYQSSDTLSTTLYNANNGRSSSTITGMHQLLPRRIRRVVMLRFPTSVKWAPCPKRDSSSVTSKEDCLPSGRLTGRVPLLPGKEIWKCLNHSPLASLWHHLKTSPLRCDAWLVVIVGRISKLALRYGFKWSCSLLGAVGVCNPSDWGMLPERHEGLAYVLIEYKLIGCILTPKETVAVHSSVVFSIPCNWLDP